MIVSDLIEPTLSTDELFLVLYCAIDELYQEIAPDWVRKRPGSGRMKMTDPEIITLSVMQEGQSQEFLRNDSELSFHRILQRDYRHLFPGLVSRSRYHRRRKALMGIQRAMLRVLMERMRLWAAWLIVDSAPVTTAESPRWKSARMSIWAAEAGYCASKGQFFLGFRLHLLVSDRGAICDFVLSPANVGERRVAEHLLAVEAKRPTCPRPVLADNGYCGEWLAGLFGSKGGSLWYALRRSQAPTSKAEAAAHRERFRRARRPVHRGDYSGALHLGSDDARGGKAAGLYAWLRSQPRAGAPRHGVEKLVPVSRTYLKPIAQRVLRNYLRTRFRAFRLRRRGATAADTRSVHRPVA